MDKNRLPEDSAINYLKSNIVIEENPTFNSIFWGFPKSSKSPLLVLFGIFLGIYFVFTLFISNIVLLPMTVEGASMYPTLNEEYTVTGNKYATDVVYLYKTQSVYNFDIVVFDATNYTGSSTSIYYIKRVIAKAGDSLQFKKIENQNSTTANYSVYLNNQLLIEDYILEPIRYYSNNQTPQFILNEETIKIPDGFIFVMGDNRNNSRDSRELGLISTDDVIGKVAVHIQYGKTIIHGIFQSIKEDYIF